MRPAPRHHPHAERPAAARAVLDHEGLAELRFELRRDEQAYALFKRDLEASMAHYGLSEEEKQAWRAIDLAALGRLGVHPYFLPQVSRLFKGAGYNHNESAAAQLYAEKMLKG